LQLLRKFDVQVFVAIIRSAASICHIVLIFLRTTNMLNGIGATYAARLADAIFAAEEGARWPRARKSGPAPYPRLFAAE